MKTKFFERLEKSLDKRGISTLHELSKKVKISSGTIQGWKREGSIPQARVLKKLAETLNVPTDWLIGKSNDEPVWKGPGQLPPATEAARYNFESALRATTAHPEGDRAVHWLGTMLLMLASGIESKNGEVTEPIVFDIVSKLLKSAKGEKVEP